MKDAMKTQSAAVTPATYARRRLVLVLTLALATFGAISFATGQAQASDQNKGNLSQSASFTYVNVHAGDTLWSLADSYAGNADHRDWIASLISLNNLSSNTLQPGQRLALPLG
jgi:LysM repeat protein